MSAVTPEVNSVGDLLTRIGQTNLQDKWGSHVRLWFRGHSDRAWKLEPSVYRAGLPADEDEQILHERHLTQDFVSYSARLLSGGESDAEIYFIQQHHRMPTRLLDWTGNPLAALYFATLGHDDRDGEIFLLDSYNFKGGHHTVRHPALLGAIRCIFDFGYNDWSQDILAVRPPAQNARIVAQSGHFTLHPKGRRLLEKASNATLHSYRIPSASKKAIRRELGLMNFNEFTIYGDLDHLASWLRAEYTKKISA